MKDLREQYSPDDFESFLVDKKSRRTAKTYKRGAIRFLDWIEANDIDLANARKAMMDDFATHLQNEGLSNSTVKLTCVATRTYLDWLRREDLELPDFLKPYLPSKEAPKPAVVLSDQAVDALLDHNTETREPYRTLIYILYTTGMRSFEACQLKLTDVHVVELAGAHRYVFDVEGKGKKQRGVPLPLEYNEVLSHYLRTWRHERYQKKPSEWLWPIRSSHVKERSLRERMQDMRQDLGLSDLSPHVLRKTYSTHLSSHDMSPLMIAQLLGQVTDQTLAFRVLDGHYINHALEKVCRKLDQVPFPVPPEYE